MLGWVPRDISRLRSFALYVLCGGSGVAFDFCIFGLLSTFGVNYQIANACGYLGGTLLSFALNRRFTFQVFDKTYRRLFKFLSIATIGFLTSWGLIVFLVQRIGLPPIGAKAIVLVVVLLLQFSLNSLWTFRLHQRCHEQ
ncbi:MAG: GtrA family protein [Proteobacteria bacterium]|nr:GtrA family protein [Pseudomonadota bacterium]